MANSSSVTYMMKNKQFDSLINIYADVSSDANGLNFGLSIHLHPYFVYASNKGLPESLLLADAISTKISCTGRYLYLKWM